MSTNKRKEWIPMQKKVAALTFALLMLLSVSVWALEVSPMWGTASYCDVSLNFTGTTANCGASIYGKDGTNKMTVKVSLQRSNGGSYSTVKTWEETVYKDSYILNGISGNCVKGTTYRLTVTATVYNTNGTSETVSNYTTAVC